MNRYKAASVIIGMVLLGFVSSTYANIPITVQILGQAPSTPQNSANNWVDISGTYGGILKVTSADGTTTNPPIVQAIPATGTGNNQLNIVNATFTLVAVPPAGTNLTMNFFADFPGGPFGTNVPFQISANGDFLDVNLNGIESGCSITINETIIQPPPPSTPTTQTPLNALSWLCSSGSGGLFSWTTAPTGVNLVAGARRHSSTIQFVLPFVTDDSMDLYAVNEHHRTEATAAAQKAMQAAAKDACKHIAKHLREGGMREAKPGKQECPKKKKHTKE